ncbi:unnamed protein product [Rotaria socialis]|uniref:Uncharacterized protein n=1 Tax=Rotaria socialis TaxID=392032 RepID=A0A818QRS4_9BILA|nr:unnamed protein product [Rotaria socialis]
MRRGINDNFRDNKKGSSSTNLKLSNISFNKMPKSNQQTTVSAFEASGTYNLEEMIAFIRQNPNVAFGVHEHHTHHTHPRPINAPAQSSTPQTPKRNLDSSDNDGAQISKQQRVLSNGKQKKTREMNFSKVPSPVHQMNNNIQLDQPRQQASVQQQHRIPFEQLKRAVSSNLPCFFIEYKQAENSKIRPSDISAARVIEDYFKQQGIAISFSLVDHAGNKLKLGVNNKESECKKVVEYRSNLKEQVEHALSADKLQRLMPQDHVQPTEFRLKQNEFPSLPSLMSCTTSWKQTSVPSAVTNNINGIEDTTKLLLSINQNILDMKDNTRRIDEKLDCINEKVHRTSLDVELHNEILMKLLPTLASLVDKFIWPMMLNDVAGLRNKQDQLKKFIAVLTLN